MLKILHGVTNVKELNAASSKETRQARKPTKATLPKKLATPDTQAGLK